jgi:hypothetical protein
MERGVQKGLHIVVDVEATNRICRSGGSPGHIWAFRPRWSASGFAPLCKQTDSAFPGGFRKAPPNRLQVTCRAGPLVEYHVDTTLAIDMSDITRTEPKDAGNAAELVQVSRYNRTTSVASVG